MPPKEVGMGRHHEMEKPLKVRLLAGLMMELLEEGVEVERQVVMRARVEKHVALRVEVEEEEGLLTWPKLKGRRKEVESHVVMGVRVEVAEEGLRKWARLGEGWKEVESHAVLGVRAEVTEELKRLAVLGELVVTVL